MILYAFALFPFAAWFAFCSRYPVRAVLTVVVVLTFGEEILSLAYNNGAPLHLVRDFLTAKDVLAWILVFALAVRGLRDRQRPFDAVGYTFFYVLILVGFFALGESPAPRLTQVESIRSAYVPILGFTTAALLTAEERMRAAKGIVPIITAGAVLSLAQLALPASVLNSTIGVGNYWVLVKQVPGYVDPTTGLPGNFFTSTGFPRLTGTFGDPLSAGEIIGATLVLAMAYRSYLRFPRIQMAILSVALLLTFTRDGWFLALFGWVAISVTRDKFIATVRRFYAAIILGALVVAVVRPVRGYFTSIFNGTSSSTTLHSEAFTRSFSLHFGFLGSGWGTGGSFAEQSYHLAVTSESVFVDLLAQIGWIGTAAILLALGLAIAREARRSPMQTVVIAIVLAEIVSAFVSENLFAFNSGYLPLFILPLIAAAPRTPKTASAARPSEARDTAHLSFAELAP